MKTFTSAQVSDNKQATAKQLATLAQLGYVAPSPLTMGDASQLIKELVENRKAEADTMITQAKEIAERTSIIDLAESRTTLRRSAAQEYEGACPKCGGEDRFHVASDWFFCRQCHPRRGDAIEFLSWVNGTSFVETCAQLVGGTLPAPVMQVQSAAKAPAQRDTWNEESERSKASEAHEVMINGGALFADDCLSFMLHRRGIAFETLVAFGIGAVEVSLPGTWDTEKQAHSYPKQPAISFPWYNHDEALVAIKYRFTEKHSYTDAKKRTHTDVSKTSRGMFSGNAFGWQALRGAGKCDVLFIAEGEMNALSIWQAGKGRIDVLSMGSESTTARLPQLVIETAKQYKHCIVWADKGSIADEAALQIGASSMYSPVTHEHPKGADANDILVSGELEAYLLATLQAIGIDWASAADDTTPHPDNCVTVGSVGDVTKWVGRNVTPRLYAEIEKRVNALGWTIEFVAHGQLRHVSRITAR